MSSNIRIQKTCEYCGKEFIAKTTVTKYCGDDCSKRAYKARKREEKIEAARQVKIGNKAILLSEVKIKDILTVPEVAVLLNCSRHTIYRLIKSGTLKAVNLGDRMTRVSKKDVEALLK
ncbi:MAG: helix-turn-helix domain-containing protein [Bacteroidota bacterium]